MRRSNPRESFVPDSQEQLDITNRHRILRIGRSYAPGVEGEKPGLLFMCLNTHIERQFEFIQQACANFKHFHGLDNEVDPILGHGNVRRITIPTESGPHLVPFEQYAKQEFKDFINVHGGSYFFLPSHPAIRFLAGKTSITAMKWKYTQVKPS